MKNIVITLSLAVAIITAAIVLDRKSVDSTSEPTIAKTLIKCDDMGRVVEETTFNLQANAWIETSRSTKEYSEESVTLVNYKSVNGDWVRVSKSVCTYDDENLISESTYQPKDGEWLLTSSVSYADLSNDETFEDILFDKDGNLIMSAQYQDNNGIISGLTKEEYVYDGGLNPCKKIGYAWSGSEWQKTEEQSLQYIR
ncbi:MAG: hypothetical protein MJZ27_00750 [Bacteroidales bacterium]|nr:hypothetical protein [Bacteroidales bacterium]